MKSKLEIFLQDFTYNSKIQFLEEGKSKELLEMAEKRGIKLPCKDLAPFKSIYAFVDRMNKNGCTLPREEVEKALDTLVGKAIDFDHFRKRVVGYWTDAHLEKDEIVAYGMFFKGNFEEDYDVIKELIEKDVLAISFEAYGIRELTAANEYNLRDIEFAGGALLLKEKPAFPGSEVLEMSSKIKGERVLELAKVMTPPETFIHEKGEEELTEQARYYVDDISSIMRMLSQVDCLNCKEKGFGDIESVDFANNKVKMKCLYCDGEMDVDLTPAGKLTKKGRKIKKLDMKASVTKVEDLQKYLEEFEGSDEELNNTLAEVEERELAAKLKYQERKNLDDDSFAVVGTVKNKKTGEPRKIRMFPIHDEAHVRNALARLGQPDPQATLNKLGVSVETAKNKIIGRARQLNMKSLLEKYQKSSVEALIQELAKTVVSRELTKEELEKAYTLVDLKAGGGSSSDQSLQTVDTKKSTANETSLQTAKITEDELKEIIKKATEVKVDETAKAKEELEAKEKEIAELKVKLEEATKKFEEAKVKLEEIAKAELAAKIKTRRDELGEYAKDLTDEQIMVDDKYTIAKLTKERDELKKTPEQKPEQAKEEPAKKPDLVKGSNEKKSQEEASRSNVRKIAYGE